MQQNKRIEWVDIYKGIAIILVVLGHSTGLFGGYIYQFHVAAFFFISGWVSRLDETDLLTDIYKKIMTFLLPLLSMVVLFGLLTTVLKICGVYKYFWEEGTYRNALSQIFAFLTNGSVINLLGASWFLLVLFFASLLSHILYIVSFKNKQVYLLVTIAVYIAGYYCMKGGYVLPFCKDIALVAQGYYGIGFFLKSSLPDISIKRNKIGVLSSVVLLSLTSFFMYEMKINLYGKNLSDIANRQMNSLGWTTVAIINGIVWLYSLSQLISVSGIKSFKCAIIEIGKSTMGFMFLHFTLFRITSIFLCLFGAAGVEEIKNNVPTSDIGDRYWGLYLIVSVIGSYIIWSCMMRVPLLRRLLGTDKELISTIYKQKPITELAESCKKVSVAIGNGIKEFKARNGNYLILLMFAIALCLVISVRFIPNKSAQNGVSISLNTISGPINVTFPYNGGQVVFDDGWLEQTEGEQYRWVRKESTFRSRLSDQSSIILSGYVPADIAVSRVDLYLNDEWIAGCDITGEQALNIEGSISEAISNGDNIFRLVFDGERVVAADAVDTRVFSAMFTSIDIQ